MLLVCLRESSEFPGSFACVSRGGGGPGRRTGGGREGKAVVVKLGFFGTIPLGQKGGWLPRRPFSRWVGRSWRSSYDNNARKRGSLLPSATCFFFSRKILCRKGGIVMNGKYEAGLAGRWGHLLGRALSRLFVCAKYISSGTVPYNPFFSNLSKLNLPNFFFLKRREWRKKGLAPIFVSCFPFFSLSPSSTYSLLVLPKKNEERQLKGDGEGKVKRDREKWGRGGGGRRKETVEEKRNYLH